jgi:hypothetical protein
MNIRQSLELSVCATNIVLKETVQTMDLIILLRNCHPIDRADFAMDLYKNKELTKEEVEEFTKLSKYGSYRSTERTPL